ncbi:AtpZ/AtpI family protein [Bartonella sp. B10]
MARDSDPIVPPKKTEGKNQRNSFSSGDFRYCSRNLVSSLMRKEALEKKRFEKKEEELKGGMARAVKLSSEFLANIIVGVVLGLGFDKLVGSLPWGLVFFLFLGFASGTLSILRSVGYIAPSKFRQSGASRQDQKSQ